MKKVSMKTRGGVKLSRWANKGRKQQRGGFLSLIIAGLIALGVEASTAAATAAVVAPVVSAATTGAVSAASAYGVNKALGGSRTRVRRRVRRIR